MVKLYYLKARNKGISYFGKSVFLEGLKDWESVMDVAKFETEEAAIQFAMGRNITYDSIGTIEIRIN